MDKDIIVDLVSLTDASDPEAPSTPDANPAGEPPAAAPPPPASQMASPRMPSPSDTAPGTGLGIPAGLPEPGAPPIDEVVSAMFPTEDGDLSTELAAALADCAKNDSEKVDGHCGEELEICGGDVAMGEAGIGADRPAVEFFELASFLGESEDTKQGLEGLGGSEGGAAGGGEGAEGSGPPHVAMGIPYYVACQWEVVQQQQQQQQAAVMLWWQAYLSSYSGMFGHPGTMPSFPTAPAGWGAMPETGMQMHSGMYPPTNVPGGDAMFPGLVNGGMGSAGGGKAGQTGSGGKRRRRQEGGGSGEGQGEGAAGMGSSNRKGRRPRQEERICKNCGTGSTPFWRKDKHDGLPLCNACGLYLSKNDAPRPKVLWKSSNPATTAVEPSNAMCQ